MGVRYCRFAFLKNETAPKLLLSRIKIPAPNQIDSGRETFQKTIQKTRKVFTGYFDRREVQFQASLCILMCQLDDRGFCLFVYRYLHLS